ncbi:HK97-gp10 family putative phage morphogenesis protein [Phascolarctobacterium faecium]|uniref:HK97-gp10 family putative phage morphogenesis protein n=1 Tax=Phascolarctobacterium faecium TaxID=33025 RepID=UPI00300F4488
MSRSMRMSVEVEGLDEALRHLKAYDTKSTEKISEAIRLGGQNIGKEARSRVPRRSGKLRKSIRTRFDSTAITSTVRTNVPYAHLVEFGAAAATVRPRSRARKGGKPKLALRIDGRGFRRFVHKSSKPGKGVVHIPARPARPYMTPAYQSGKPRIENDIKKVLREMPK